MKKYFISILFVMVVFLFSGCNKTNNLYDNFSEVTYIYFQASTEGVSSSICVGQREEPYIIDGKHMGNCAFSLISLKFNQQLEDNLITVDIKINNEITEQVLELNPANHYYMADLGYELNEDDDIEIAYKNYNLCYKNISKDFAISYKDAISISEENYKEYIEVLSNKKNFNGECYLKILTLKNDGKEGLFWIFTIVDNNKQHKNIIINVDNGEVLIKD